MAVYPDRPEGSRLLVPGTTPAPVAPIPFSRSSALGRALAWLRNHPYTLLAAIFFGIYAFPFLLRQHGEWHEVYVQAGRRLLAGEYLYATTPDYMGYVYPPFAALVAAPFSVVPPAAARLAWYLVNVVCLVSLLRWAWRLSGGGALEGPRAGGGSEHLICCLGLACGLSYAVNCLAHQQSDLLITALLMGGCVALSRSRGWLAATAFGFAAAIKCTPLLWGPYLFWRGRWKEAAWLVCVAVGANLLPNLFSAPEPGRLYLVDWASRFLLPMTDKDHCPGVWASAPIYNQSAAGTISRVALTQFEWQSSDGASALRPDPISPGAVKLLVHGSQLLLIAGLLFVLGRRPQVDSASPSRTTEVGAEYSMVLLMMLFLSPMSNTQHFVTTLLPAYCLARLAVERRRTAPAILLLAAIAMRATSINWLWGEWFSSLCLWLGCVTVSAGFLLAGCACVLLSAPRAGNRVSGTPEEPPARAMKRLAA